MKFSPPLVPRILRFEKIYTVRDKIYTDIFDLEGVLFRPIVDLEFNVSSFKHFLLTQSNSINSFEYGFDSFDSMLKFYIWYFNHARMTDFDRLFRHRLDFCGYANDI